MKGIGGIMGCELLKTDVAFSNTWFCSPIEIQDPSLRRAYVQDDKRDGLPLFPHLCLKPMIPPVINP